MGWHSLWHTSHEHSHHILNEANKEGVVQQKKWRQEKKGSLTAAGPTFGWCRDIKINNCKISSVLFFFESWEDSSHKIEGKGCVPCFWNPQMKLLQLSHHVGELNVVETNSCPAFFNVPVAPLSSFFTAPHSTDTFLRHFSWMLYLQTKKKDREK